MQDLRLPALIAFALLQSPDAKSLTYYSRNSGVNWNTNASWSTAGYGGPPASSYPGVNDTAKIGDGYTIQISSSIGCTAIEIGQGTSGTLQFQSGGNYTLTVSGWITVNSGAMFWYNSNNGRTHALLLGGNFSNNGTVDFYSDANDVVNMTFNGSSSGVVSGSGSWALNNVMLTKSVSTASIEIQSTSFESAISTLTLNSGTFIHNNSSSYSVNSSGSSDFSINQNSAFKILQGTVSFSPNSTRLYLYGSLCVNGGNVFVGTSAGTMGIRYDQIGSTVASLEVTAGSLTVYGGITFASGASNKPFSFRMTGGSMLLNCGSSGCNAEPFLVNDLSASAFTMSGGTITIQSPNGTGVSVADWGICGNYGAVNTTGGLVQFGNSFTANNQVFTFIPYESAVQPGFVLAGPTAYSIRLCAFNPTTSSFRLLSMRINAGKTYDNKSYIGLSGDEKTMTLTGTGDSSYAFYNDGTFIARTGTVVLAGNTMQSVGGSTNTQFYNLTVSNSAHAVLQSPVSVSNYLSMNSGKLYTTASNILTCMATGSSNLGSDSSFIDGPLVHTIATTDPALRNYPVGKGNSYRPAVVEVLHSSIASVTYKGEMINASAEELNYSVPSTVDHVSRTRYWDFDRQNTMNLVSASMTLYYNTDDSISDYQRVVMVHDGGSSNWVDYGGTATGNTTGSLTATGITVFNRKFTIAFPPSPLPVLLLDFTVEKSRDVVICEWSTAAEINNDYFTLERSLDGIDFDSLKSVDGAGNSTTVQHYRCTDERPLKGHSYYRLKQTDEDGRYAYSEARHVFTVMPSVLMIYPNPGSGRFFIVHDAVGNQEDVKVRMQDMKGHDVPFARKVFPDKKVSGFVLESDRQLKEGYYFVSILTGGEWQQQKIYIDSE